MSDPRAAGAAAAAAEAGSMSLDEIARELADIEHELAGRIVIVRPIINPDGSIVKVLRRLTPVRDTREEDA